MKILVRPKILRTSAVPMSLNILLKGQFAYLSEIFEIVALSSKGKDLEELEKREKVRTITVEIQRNISLFKDFISLAILFWKFKKEKPLIVHSITPKAGLLSMLAAKLAGVPIRIHTFTGLIFPSKTGAMRTLLIKMDQLLCWAATNVYPEGNGVKNDLEKYKITTKPLKVLANGNINGIDLQYFNPDLILADDSANLRKKSGIHESDFVFIFVGRLVKDKGINELVAAFSKIRDPNAKLLLVGPFEQELDPLSDHILEEIEANANIVSVGFQQDVRPYFAVANALVFPSYREGFPNVVMQAGAMGLPSIVSNINGCNEIIIEGKNGSIIPAKNEDALKMTMENFMTDEMELSKLKINARSMIKDRYEQSVVWDALLEEYNFLIADKMEKNV